MKKIIIFFALILVSSAVSMAGVPISDLNNPHNLSSAATHGGPKALPPASGGSDQICVFCHTPHSGTPQSTLWSRPDPDSMGSFPLYAQPLAIKTDIARTGYDAGSAQYPSGASRMCLSCHDGVTAIGILIDGNIVMDGSSTITTPSAIIDLATSHPISFNYNNDVILNVLNPANYQLPDGSIDTPLDANSRMQCTTCHDPHSDTRISSGENLPFWRHEGPATVTLYDDVCNQCHTGATSGSPPPIHNIP